MDQDYGGCESANSVQEEAQKQDGTGTNPLPDGPLAPQVRFDLAKGQHLNDLTVFKK